VNPIEYQLKQLVKLFSSAKIDYAILGGIAVSIYGEPRLTLDIDVNIMLDMAKLDDFLNKAKRYGFFPIPKNIKKFIRTTGVMPTRFSKGGIAGKCDFIIAQNALEYSGIKRVHFKKIYSTKVKLISPEDLIIHKITSDRPRDIEDISGILMRQKGELDLNYITSWLKRIPESNKRKELLHLFRDLIYKKG
jgi:hypothetical protein